MHHSKSPLEERPFIVKPLSVLFLIVIVTFLIGCRCPSYVYDDLFWLEPVEFSQETKDWLMERSPWPDYVREDINKVATLNDSIRTIRNLNQ